MFRSLSLAFLFLAFAFPTPSPAQPGPLVAASMDAADREDWVAARRFAADAGDPAAMDLFEWRLLSAGVGNWTEYSGFVARNSDWPNLARIRREGEATIPSGATLQEIDAFLSNQPPQTGAGALARANALRASGRREEADREIVRAWRELSLTSDERSIILSRHAALLAPHHEARADNLLWRGLTSEARAMKSFVSDGWARLIEARAKLRRRENGVDPAIEAVPDALISDPGLAYERFVWRMRARAYEGALEILQARTGGAASLGRPEEWGNRRRLLVRRLYRQGRHTEAYNLANL
ncbi:MAG: lytic transglycosylase domain-containing protein, partial [Pseudomonadota bacterium]